MHLVHRPARREWADTVVAPFRSEAFAEDLEPEAEPLASTRPSASRRLADLPAWAGWMGVIGALAASVPFVRS